MFAYLKKWLRQLPGLGPLLQDVRALQKARANRCHQFAHFAYPGHYYSPIPGWQSIDRATAEPPSPHNGLHGIDLNLEGQATLWVRLCEHFAKLDLARQACPARRYYSDNSFFSHGDALVTGALMLAMRPGRILEIGSGFSSALMLDVSDIMGKAAPAMTFIEPDPVRLNRLLRAEDRKRVEVIEGLVQSQPTSLFSSLQAGDWLFIDSSHVGKCGSDLLFLLFEVLPRLKAGVLVHIHDIFWPFEYPKDWYAEGRAWNEAYFIRTLLLGGNTWRVLFWNSCFERAFPDEVRQQTDGLPSLGASLWLVKS
jgi:hypothetical protein